MDSPGVEPGTRQPAPLDIHVDLGRIVPIAKQSWILDLFIVNYDESRETPVSAMFPICLRLYVGATNRNPVGFSGACGGIGN